MDLFKLLGTIAVDNASANKALEETGQMGRQTEDKLTKAFSGIGKGAVVVGKAVASGLAVAGTAIGGVVAKAVQGYADYEQLVGGVDTLFKGSSAKVQEYAANAFKTAGLSANEYMETVTSFSASLLQSLGGDTAKAAEKADLAITDMSDNANKMGTSMEMIQNAYQGFAKQNYTMLDNLKLGYGGTQEEMQRLLKDAQAISGIEYDISSYADVVDAIHVIQTEMGITGTTAKEAQATISGSIAMTKSAWSNLMVGLAQDNANIPQLVTNVVSSGAQVLKNIIPVAKQVLESIPAAISEISPRAGAAFQGMINIFTAALPVLKTALTTTFDIITKAFNFISEHTGLLTAVAVAIGVIVTALGMYNAVAAIKAAMAAAEVTTVWGLVSAYAAQAVAMVAAIAPYLAIAAAIAAVIAIGVLLVKNWDTIKAKCSELVASVGAKFSAMRDGIAEKLNSVKTKALSIFTNIKDTISEKIQSARDAVKAAIDKIKGFFDFEWSLPKIKLPHFSITGKFSLNPPSIPHFSVEWYKKAMLNPMIMTEPTIFGYNPKTGKAMGGGEAGSEVVSGTNTLMNMIGDAVESRTAAQNERIIALLTALLNAIVGGNQELLQALLADKTWKVGEREFARLVREYA